MARGGYTYIMTNKTRGVLYVGVTVDIPVCARNDIETALVQLFAGNTG
jgi:predicted GIY-YIG superfamily endonuclease